MKSLVHTEELCSRSVPLEHAPGAKSLVCIGLKVIKNGNELVFSFVYRNSMTDLLKGVTLLKVTMSLLYCTK